MAIHDLPTELLVHITSFLDDGDFSSLLRASRELHALLDTHLLSRNARRYDPSRHGYGLVYRRLALIATARAGGPLATFRKALAATLDIAPGSRPQPGTPARRLADMALREAVLHGHTHLVEHQLAADPGLDLGKTTLFGVGGGNGPGTGRSLLYSEPVLSRSATFEVLLRSGRFDPGAVDAQGVSLLAHAAAMGHLAICRHLLLPEFGLDPDARDISGATALARAAEGGHVDVMDLLVATGAVNVNALDVAGFTPLQRAIKARQTASVRSLLSNEAIDLTAGAGVRDLLPLQQAAAHGMLEVVEMLLARGLDVNGVYCGNTALTLAASAGHADVVTRLLAQPGVWVNSNPPLVPGSPLVVAARRKHVDVARILLEYAGPTEGDRVDVNARGAGGKTALAIAAAHGDMPTLKLLLAAPGIQIDLVDSAGMTATDLARDNMRTEAEEELVKWQEAQSAGSEG